MRSTFQQVVSGHVLHSKKLALFLGDIGVYGFREVLSSAPDRAQNLGIMEQAMVSYAAGFARQGLRPVIHTIAPFLVERALEQIKIDFGYNGLGGVIVTVGAPFDYSKLGATHHCPGDLEILGSVPTLKIKLPVSRRSLEKHLTESLNANTLDYIRVSEESVDDEIDLLEETRFGFARASDTDSAFVFVGTPPKDLIPALVSRGANVFVLEDFSYSGELCEMLSQSVVNIIEYAYEGSTARLFTSLSGQVRHIGIPRRFIHNYGEVPDLRRLAGLDTESLLAWG